MPAKLNIPESKSKGVFGQSRKPVKTLRAGLYARVSTLDQQTLPMQMRALREYAARRGWTVVEECKEVGSGAVARAMRQRLIDSARRRDIDVVLVWRLDRWGRSVADLVSTLQELTALGVGFVSVTEALDLTTPAGRAMAGLLSVFAEFERDIMRERVRAGLAHARMEGKRLGQTADGRWQSELRQEPISRRNQQIGDCATAWYRSDIGSAAAGAEEILSGGGSRRLAERTPISASKWRPANSSSTGTKEGTASLSLISPGLHQSQMPDGDLRAAGGTHARTQTRRFRLTLMPPPP